MLVYERPVRFEDVDAAGLLFFPRFLNYAHEAMVHLFDTLPGGYVDLIKRRKLGFPAVHVTSDFRAPLRFGDVARIAVTVSKLGTSSCTFHYAFTCDNVDIATMDHVVVCTNVEPMSKVALPDDVRAVLELHR